MENREKILSLYKDEHDNMISSSNFELLEVNQDIAGLNTLVKIFYESVVKNEYCGPKHGTPEYNDMIDDVFAHIVKTLDSSTAALDEINTDIDCALFVAN